MQRAAGVSAVLVAVVQATIIFFLVGWGRGSGLPAPRSGPPDTADSGVPAAG